MTIKSLHIKFLLFLCCINLTVYAQEDLEDLLSGEVETLNPVYKPIIGVGVGAFNFLGDVRNSGNIPYNGSLGYNVNITTFLDNEHSFRANFFFMGGSLTGNERSSTDLTKNMNFKSDVMLFGININYDFDHFYKTYRQVHPFISIGIETITFDSKTDSLGTEDVRYNYWTDGSIRNLPEGSAGAELIKRDNIYETPLRQNDWGLGKYPQYAFAVPIDAGLDFWLADRVMFRVGTSFHFVFSDLIDHVSSKNTSGRIGDNNSMDNFMFSYLSMHLDLFSSDKTQRFNKFFLEMDFDPTLHGDEDGDGYFDGWDNCPKTPFGVETDTAGCPLDDDFDGIYNYLDDEPNSRYGAYVDEKGVEISEDDLIAKLDMSNAVPHAEAALYVRSVESYSKYGKSGSKQIPEKFVKVDADADGYISFDEMMDSIDSFFDFDSDMTSEDIYELNDFFFTQ